MPEIPDFTDASWQTRRSDAQLRASILDGKGTGMPAAKGKISEEQAGGLVTHLRGFAPASRKQGQEEKREPDSGDFEKRFRRLQEELDDLKKQYRRLPKASPSTGSPKPPQSPQGTPGQRSESPQRPPPGPPAVTAAGKGTAPRLFRQHCMKCHGEGGTGKPARGRQPGIPDFTDASWQARRSDKQLLASILEGKGKEMPSWHGKISEEQARGLIAYVRGFAPAPQKREGGSQAATHGRYHEPKEEQQEISATEPATAEPRGGFLRRLVGWLGKFHPAAVHFPIALLTAGAVAQLLRMVTAKAAFDFASRYCVWFGTLTAAFAGVLGWFVGIFRLAGASWLMITHACLGTSTVACAGLVLALSEATFRSDRGKFQLWFRLTLLVLVVLILVTGFFGGAVAFGLEHYSWPL